MAKTKTPFLSLGSQGTVGGVLTSQKRGSTTLLRQKPIPTDPYSLNQAYQRWDYRDYAYLWTLLSNSEKQVYRTKASRYHITGFSQWMRENLKDLTNLVGRWHLDEETGAIAYDNSRNPYNGTLIGTSLATGLIGRARWFDGINDFIPVIPFASKGEMNIQNATLETFLRLSQLGVQQGVISLPAAGLNKLVLRVTNANKLQALYWNTLNAAQIVTANTPLLIDTWYHVAFTLEGNVVVIYLDGIVDGGATKTGTLWQGIDYAELGRYAGGSWLKGYLDEAIVHSETLDITTLKRHSERRYPA